MRKLVLKDTKGEEAMLSMKVKKGKMEKLYKKAFKENKAIRT